MAGIREVPRPRPESGYQKVALYGSQNLWTHAALQTPNGRWRSKLGVGPLVEHQTLTGCLASCTGAPTFT